MRPLFFIFLFQVLIPSFSGAQSEKKKAAVYKPGPTSLEPSPFLEEVYGPRIAKKKSKAKIPAIESREEFEMRMKRTAKMINKRERMLRKPQYSNPLYFGHKRPPKKHKAGNLKFCRECEIRH